MDSGIKLQDCFKTWKDKTRPPSETIAWARSRLGSADADLLGGTERIDKDRLGIPVFVSRCGLDAVRLLGKPVQMGKGTTSLQAEASALMELVERISLARFAAPNASPLRTRDTLPGSAMGLEALARSVGDERTDLDQLSSLFHSLPMRWVLARNLTQARDEWLPFDWFHRIHESNGAAAGNTLEEAVVQGTCELLERHVASLVTRDERDTPWIRNATVDPTESRALAEKMTRSGIKLYLKDFTLNTGVPTVGVVAYDPETFPDGSELVFTAGTATSPGTAVVRAITEAAQLAGDFLSKTRYQPTLPRYETLEAARYLVDTTQRTDLSRLPDISSDNLLTEIATLTERLAAQAFTLYAVNVTDSDLEVPAVFMVAPGMQLQDRTRSDTVLFHFCRLASLTPEPGRAIQRTRRFLEAFPERFEALFFAAYALERAGMFAQALPMFRRALDADPGPAHLTSVYAHIGECLRRLGDIDGAIRTLLAATALENAQKEAYQVLGQCYFLRKDYYKAIDAFGQAIQRDANSALDYANLGACMRELGYRDEAIRLYEISMRLDPSLDAARGHLERLRASPHSAQSS